MARRRNRGRFTKAFSAGNRQYYWWRQPPTSISLREASTATFSDIILSATDVDNSTDLEANATKKGGPRLERMIMQYGLGVDGTNDFWSASGDANISLIPEFMIWIQSEQFFTYVTTSAEFDQTVQKERVLMDEVAIEQAGQTPTTGGRIRVVSGHYESKVKARLRESSIGIAARGFFNTGSANLLGWTIWYRPTLLISVP